MSTKNIDGSTHWQDCWRKHHKCAVAEVERLTRFRAQDADAIRTLHSLSEQRRGAIKELTQERDRLRAAVDSALAKLEALAGQSSQVETNAGIEDLMEVAAAISTMDCFHTGSGCPAGCACLAARALRAYERHASKPPARHTLDCAMVKHPNCTQCDCGSSIDTHRDPSRPSAGQKVIRDTASESVRIPGADPACDGSGHPAGSQSGVPPRREGETGGVTSNAGTSGVAETSDEPILQELMVERGRIDMAIARLICGDPREGVSISATETTVRCPVIIGLDAERQRCVLSGDHTGACRFDNK